MRVVKDVLDPARSAACAAVLGRPVPNDVLPPFWHHLHFWDVSPPDALGRDGHPAQGKSLVPDVGLPRRMWAGGTVYWVAPLHLGRPAERQTRLGPVQQKKGRSGPLALVCLHHEVWQDGRLCLRERQDLVYRPDPAPDSPAPAPPRAARAPVERVQVFDDMTLLRYSALTMNGHRIHWDKGYATGVEGHRGLVVHGPLLAEGLIALAEAELGPLAHVSYRATAPAVVGETVTFCLDGTRAWVRGAAGEAYMTAEVRARG
ncbi:hypothetical protein JANAI62_15790 [Jannaschia pagri]|uniref:3-methylfumaryl-CoA hydratase n=2 Tax=Jannaschia pagri TaxID=2829797 RepID=A0ABQ4NKL6_9RHOB|nr:acyl dehydratase [Jannaschia sp. AI_61]GIT91124.1 hypothetical protein JANAI61_15820 [Jannaschia sp. AI_61]GIT94956.1 hypothetical protein JANAI62_15790 [Jannaschia sp. AI_62]